MLPSMFCPICGGSISGTMGMSNKATDYNNCYRKCKTCNIAFSNSSTKPVLIYRNPEQNVPAIYRNSLIPTLNQTINKGSRVNKFNRFCSEDSEDAVTWTLVNTIIQEDLTSNFAYLCGISTNSMPEVLFWGVPVSSSANGIKTQLIGILRSLKENSNFYTEPDVIFDYREDGLIIIETPNLIRNKRKESTLAGWSRYNDPKYFKNYDEMVSMRGLYQLTRNWRVGCELANDKKFVLLNIVRDEDMGISETELDVLMRPYILQTKNRTLKLLSWNSILELFNPYWAVHHYAKMKSLIYEV